MKEILSIAREADNFNTSPGKTLRAGELNCVGVLNIIFHATVSC